jgi:hypothetical protein
MRKITTVLLGAVFLAGGTALAKLPAPTPEQQAAAATKKAQEEEQLKKEKALLERAQDRVAERYKKSGGSASAGSGQQTSSTNMPKTTSELPGGTGPKPERPISAEAHSAPAK